MTENEAREILVSMNIPLCYSDVSIEIDSSKCPLGCNICVSNCPTNALYFFQKVNVQQDLCVGCGACLFSCMYDGIIKISRTNERGIKENFDSKKGFTQAMNAENSRKRAEQV